MKINKEKEVKTELHKKRIGKIHKKNEAKIDNKSMTTRAKRSATSVGRMAESAITENVEGGENIDGAFEATGIAIRPVKGTISEGNRIRKKISTSKLQKEVAGKKIRKKSSTKGKELAKKSAKNASKNVDNLFELLFQKGVAVTRYHAGLNNETRKKNQEDFIYDRTPVIIATNAFGMGIDKSNVRYVIHYTMPQSMENYYQEAGRAGRDGENSQCVLLFSAQDVMIDRMLLDNKDFSDVDEEDEFLIRQRDIRRLQIMEGYCKTTGCLRNYILEYFGEKTFGPCDNCGNCHREYHETDMTREAKWVVNCVAETRGRYGLTIVLGTLLGAKRARLRELGADKYKSYGALNDHSEAELRALISQMTEMGYLYQTQERYSVLKLGDISPLRDENTHVIMRTYEEKEPDKKKKPQKSVRKRSTDALTAAGYDLFEALRKLRLEIAKEEAMPPYIVFSDKTLIDMCIKCPSNEEEMLEVSGVGENKLKKYGQRFLEEIQKFCLERPNAVLSMSEDENGNP